MRAAREVVGDGAAPEVLANRALRELVNCYEDYGPRTRNTPESVNARARRPFRRAVNRDRATQIAGARRKVSHRIGARDWPTLIT